MNLLAILTILKEKINEFETFETGAARVMRSYGGELTHTFRSSDEPTSPHIREFHWLTFPTKEAYYAYRSDPRLAVLQPLREQSVMATEIVIGETGPHY
jgi:hypothetical protein